MYLQCYHSVDMNGAISLVNHLKGYFRINSHFEVLDVIRNPPCDTKKLYHAALSPVQLVHLLEHVVLSQSTRSCYVWETNCNAFHRIVLRDVDSNDMRQLSIKPWKLQNKFDSNIFKNIKKTIFNHFLTFFTFLLRKFMSTEWKIRYPLFVLMQYKKY